MMFKDTTSSASLSRLTPPVAMALTASAGMAMILILFRFFGTPEPYVHDEFAYLLGADTLLEGRFTNPTPPMSEFFETFHVNMTPTYHSKYPPGQSVFLAIGTWTTGDPVHGVWLSFLLGSVALTWALCAIVPPKWALLGGCLSTLNSTILMSWAFTYWGGSVAMLGGALFLGGLLRLSKAPVPSAAVWAGAGLFLMAFTRPLEGLITASLPTLAYLSTLPVLFREKGTRTSALRILIILGGAGLLILGLNLAYNHHLTGSAFTFPHSQWTSGESIHTVIRNYQGSTDISFLDKLQRQGLSLVPPVLWVLIAISLIRWDRTCWIGLFTATGLIAYSSMISRGWPHYIAPAAPILYGLVILGGITLCHAKWGTPTLRNALFAVLITLYAGFEIRRLALEAPKSINPNLSRQFGRNFKRDIDSFLAGQPGQHLVFTRYLTGHNVSWEYVYNRADIPNAKVIWAREMEAEQNAALLEAYPGRNIWLVKMRTLPVHMLPVESGVPTSIP